MRIAAGPAAALAATRRFLAARRVELLLVALLAPTYAYFYQSGQHNESVRFDLTRALSEDHTVVIERYAYNTADAIEHRRGGETVVLSGKAPGTSLIAVPPFWCFARLTARLGLADWVRWHLVAWLTTVLTVGLLSAVAAAATYSLVRRRTGEPLFALLAVLALQLGSIAFPFSTLFFSHQQAASLFALALALLCGGAGPDEAPGPGPGRVLLAGALVGLAVATEYPAILLAGVIAGYLALARGQTLLPARRRLLRLGAFLAGLGAAAAAILAPYNLAAFGRLLYVPYQAYAEGTGSAFPAHREGYIGLHWPGLGPFFSVLAELTVRPQRGLLYLGFDGLRPYATNPVLWLALPGLGWMLARREWRKDGLLALAALAVYLGFNACFGDSIVYWGGGHSVGPRQLIPMLPFLALPLAIGARRLRGLFLPLLALSVFYMLLATAVEPRVPYIYRNPARELFLPQFLAGHLALSREGLFDPLARPLVGSSVAFNLGGLLGLPGEWQLGPLMAWWAAVGGALLRAAGARRWFPCRAGLALLAALVVALPVGERSIARLQARGGGLRARYYANVAWQGEPADVRVDPTLDFDWPESPPLPTPFSAEWSGLLRVEKAGVYWFAIESDDGSTLEVGGALRLDNGGEHAARRVDGSAALAAGSHSIRVRYFNSALGGRMRLWWKPPDGPEEMIPSGALTPAG